MEVGVLMLFEFMGQHPFLTFFLAMIVANTIVGSLKAIFGNKK